MTGNTKELSYLKGLFTMITDKEKIARLEAELKQMTTEAGDHLRFSEKIVRQRDDLLGIVQRSHYEKGLMTEAEWKRTKAYNDTN